MPVKKYSCLLPMRMDLAGGTLDIWPLYLMIQDSATVQCSVDLFVSVCLEPKEHSDEISLRLGGAWLNFSSLSEFLKIEDQKLSLIQSFCAYFKPAGGFALEIRSDSPQGGGLGASSAVGAGLLKCFSDWLGGAEYSFKQALFLCRDLEAQALKAPAGLQDYIIPLQAVFQNQEESQSALSPSVKKEAGPGGGKKSFFLNIIEWEPGKPKISTLALPEDVSKKHLLLVDSGVCHHSGQSNWSVIRRALAGEERALSLFEQCRDTAQAMAKACLEGEYTAWPDLFEKEYQTRKKLDISYAPREIEEIRKIVLSQGGRALKIMGAGGGGCILIWADQKTRLQQACLEKSIRILSAFDPK